jgi:diaminopimelate epimerase
VIEPRMGADGRVTVDMGAPIFEPAACRSTPPASMPSPTAAGRNGT